MMPRASSATIVDQTFAAPLRNALPSSQVAKPGSDGSRGMGSNCQRSAPVRASKACTVPGGASVRRLSMMNEPTATTPETTTGAEKIADSPFHLSTGRAIATSPFLPKPAQRRPVRESTAMRRESTVPMKMRVAQAEPAGACGSCHRVTPRQL